MTDKKRKGQPPPRYDEAFRQGAIRLVTEQNRSPQEAAQELGICVDTMKAWLRRAGASSGGAKNTEGSRLKSLEAENRALKKALAEKAEAVEILKNRSASFPNRRRPVPLCAIMLPSAHGGEIMPGPGCL